MNPQTRNALIIWGIIILVALGVGGYFGVDYLIKSSKLSPFKPHLQTYLAQPAPAGAESQGGSYVKGKVITVDSTKRELDWLYFDLPDDLRAKTPDDVGTVVWLQWGEEKDPVGYDDGADAIWRTVNITVIDKSANKIVGTHHTRGGSPPDRKEGSGAGYGSKPTEQAVQYLKSLARR